MLLYSLIALVPVVLDLISCQNADKYTDENRPYKFGFNIDGYQHRKEEKNEKGIIQGEYGFITADGYYRVTKYETDENGDFKIISQKNYYVGFPPENPTTITPPSNPQNNFHKKAPPLNEANPNLNVQNQKAPLINSPVLTTKRLPYQSTTIPNIYRQPTVKPSNLFQGQAGCSDCIIPTTKKPTTASDPQKYSVDYRVGLNFVETADENERGINPGRQDKSLSNNGPSAPDSVVGNVKENIKPAGPGSVDDFSADKPEEPLNLRKYENPMNLNNINENGNKNPSDLKSDKFAKFDSDVNPQKPNFGPKNEQQNFENAPKTPSKSNLPVKNKSLGDNKLGKPKENILNNLSSRSELNNPENLANNDTENGLLYTFNYTVDFHGHHEDGYRNGDKQGDYFFDGKDGTNRKVNYLANEFGYQPNITLSDLNENDKTRLDESNEKHKGLKGYEFKWFYRN